MNIFNFQKNFLYKEVSYLLASAAFRRIVADNLRKTVSAVYAVSEWSPLSSSLLTDKVLLMALWFIKLVSATNIS